MKAKTITNFLQKEKKSFKSYFESFLLFSLLAMLVSCDKTEADYPGISIYKTNGDYFELVDVGVDKGKITRIPTAHYLSTLLFSTLDTAYKARIRLANGYVLDLEANVKNDTYLSLTWKELFLKEIKSGGHVLTADTLTKYIIDTNPYKEFYRETKYPQKYLPPNILNDTAEINTIIRNGELDKYFEHIK